ncbi:MAG: ATP-dependent protease [Alphaproteobacteria bacterium]|nr:ATP-dependent protease [Alphaproteobacteria bacterium]
MLKNELSYKDLYTPCSLKTLSFKTTKDVENNSEVIGQEKAIDAILFAMNMPDDGYNVFCLGSEGNGKKSLALQLLKKEALSRKAPDDWCYVNNFDFSHKPKAIRLPAGKGKTFAKDIEKFINAALNILPSIFEDNNYNKQVQMIQERFKNQREEYFASLQEIAKGKKNVAILRMPTGLVVAPTKDGEVLTPETFDKLPKTTRKRILDQMSETQTKLQEAVKEVPKWEKEEKEQINLLNEQMTRDAVQGLVLDLSKKYADIPAAKEYIEHMDNDIIENVTLFLDEQTEEEDALSTFIKKSKKNSLIMDRYKVNLFVHHSPRQNAPVIYLENPNLPNLVGRMERTQHFGTLTTDFSLIKPGALHLANGGFLIIEAKDICSHPAAWESLKRALKAKKIHIESAEEEAGVMSTTTLEPEPIPLDIKIVLIGEPELYYTLSELDPDFLKLFKVEANFYPKIERDEINVEKYVSLMAMLVQKYKLRAFSKNALERLIEYSSRMSEDATKLTTRLSVISDLMKESDYFARLDKSPLTERRHVEDAIRAKIERSNNSYKQSLEYIKNGTIIIKTTGKEVGQINILAVQEFGHIRFGRPSRLTCQVYLGDGKIIDIEREVELGGPLHTKGVLILSSFLASTFGQNEALSFNASLAIEQSYGPIDGDSASSAELYALLSALSKQPIKQGIAVTGSVNQLGQVQAIGGVNEKIEGFFDVCRINGLTGEQGVIVPKTNVRNLMLREDVVTAVQKGLFHIYAVSTIAEGIEILTGVPAGSLGKNGTYPKNSIYGKTVKELHRLFKAANKRKDK